MEFVEGGSCHDVLLTEVEGQRVPKLISGRRVSLQVLGRCTSQEPCCFGLAAAVYHLVIDVDFRKRLLDKRHPPTAVLGWLRESRLVVVCGEEIVDGHLLGSALHKHFQCKDTLVIVLVLVEYAGDEAVDLAQGGEEGEEVVVAQGSLLEVVIEELAGLLVLASEQADRGDGALSTVFGDVMEIARSSEVLEPREVFGEAADRLRVLLPRYHRLIRRERVIREDLAGALDLCPVDWALLQPIYVIVAIMRLLFFSVLVLLLLINLEGGRKEALCRATEMGLIHHGVHEDGCAQNPTRHYD